MSDVICDMPNLDDLQVKDLDRPVLEDIIEHVKNPGTISAFASFIEIELPNEEANRIH